MRIEVEVLGGAKLHARPSPVVRNEWSTLRAGMIAALFSNRGFGKRVEQITSGFLEYLVVKTSTRENIEFYY